MVCYYYCRIPLGESLQSAFNLTHIENGCIDMKSNIANNNNKKKKNWKCCLPPFLRIGDDFILRCSHFLSFSSTHFDTICRCKKASSALSKMLTQCGCCETYFCCWAECCDTFWYMRLLFTSFGIFFLFFIFILHLSSACISYPSFSFHAIGWNMLRILSNSRLFVEINFSSSSSLFLYILLFALVSFSMSKAKCGGGESGVGCRSIRCHSKNIKRVYDKRDIDTYRIRFVR